MLTCFLSPSVETDASQRCCDLGLRTRGPYVPFLFLRAHHSFTDRYRLPTVAANSARDVGARLMAMCIWGRQASGGNYAALSALTNIVSMLASAMFYEIFFTDSSRGTPPLLSQLTIQMKLILDFVCSPPPGAAGLPLRTQGPRRAPREGLRARPSPRSRAAGSEREQEPHLRRV